MENQDVIDILSQLHDDDHHINSLTHDNNNNKTNSLIDPLLKFHVLFPQSLVTIEK